MKNLKVSRKKRARQGMSDVKNSTMPAYIGEENPPFDDDGFDFEVPRMSDIKDFLHKNGIFHWCGDINRAAAEEITEWIIAHNMNDKKAEHLTLIVSSYGGVVDYSFAITDMMMGSAIPVRTIGLGVIASCGLMIFMAGAKGHRILTPNTSILSHQWSGGDYGAKEHELMAGRICADLTTDKIMRHYKKCTGLAEKKIREKLLPPQDVWLTAEEAKTLKLCDDIKLVS